MGTTIRTVTAIALALPLLASAPAASAARPDVFREKGAYAYTWFEGAETSKKVPGNYVAGDLEFRGTTVGGYLVLLQCDEGETPEGDEETGDNACDFVDSYLVRADDLVVVDRKGRTAVRTYSGTVDLYAEEGEEGEEGDAPVVSDVPLELTFTSTGAPARSTFSYTVRDPGAGYWVKVRETQVISPASVDGTFWTLEIDGADGGVGRYAVRSMERID